MTTSRRTSISSPASVGSPLPPNVVDSGRSDFVSDPKSVELGLQTFFRECRKSRMSEISMADSIVESPCLPGVFHASRGAVPGSEEARMMTVRSGRKCAELFKKQGHIGSLVKTCLESLNWHSTACYLTWRPMATRGGRLLFRLAPSGVPPSENGCFWYTPTARDGKGRSGSGFIRRKLMKAKSVSSLCDQTFLLGRRDLMLSPKFRLLLMGFPIHWLDQNAKPLETRSSLKSPKSSCAKSSVS